MALAALSGAAGAIYLSGGAAKKAGLSATVGAADLPARLKALGGELAEVAETLAQGGGSALDPASGKSSFTAIGVFVFLGLAGLAAGGFLLVFARRRYDSPERATGPGVDAADGDIQTERSRMAEATKAKDVFFATMSHEIRTPMNAVLGMAELLLSEPLSEKQMGCVKDIKNASQALLTIVNDILDLSRLEAGELSLIPVHYDPSRMLDNIRSMGFFLAKEKSLHFRFDCGAGFPECLFGDDVRLRQVLLNVVGNAIKFTKQGEVSLLAAADGNWLRFDVVDTGIGIRKEDIPGLFDAFKQADTRRNRNVKGAGLGLAISKTLVERMGGSITVHSEYGRGSTFVIRIPNVAGDPEKVEGEEGLQVEFSPSAKVLVVDDKEINLRVAKGLIQLFDIECRVAASGDQALAMVKRDCYDIIFMDHFMPDMDGLETARRIRELGGRRAVVPIIGLSAAADAESRSELLEGGMNDFLAKPIERRKLQSILSKWMPRNSESTRMFTQRIRSETEARKKSEQAARGSAAPSPASSVERPPRTLTEMAQRIPGLDVDTGLKHVSGQQDLYEEILNLACETMPAIIDSINAASEAGDTRRLHIEIHGAKGSLASIGAVDLAAMAAELENAAAAGDISGVRAGLPDFLEGLCALGDRLQSLFIVFSSPATVIYGNRTQLAARMHKLVLALHARNGKQADSIVKSVVTRDFGQAINAQLDKLRICVDAGDYAAAVKQAEEIVRSLDEN